MVFTFGELMMRLSPPGHQRFTQASSFDLTFGGAEANVAISLAQFGMASAFISKLPSHQLGQAALNHLRQSGVDASGIVRGGQRLGVYFLETGAGHRSSNVIYDRAHSAFATLQPDEVNWNALLEKADWFHWTGITPALGEGPRACVQAACEAARTAGVPVSCDLNFRGKLWTPAEAQSTMRPLMNDVDVCIAGRGDAQTMLGIEPRRSDRGATEVDEALYTDLAKSVKTAFDFDAVAITLRESFNASRHGWSALLVDDGDCDSGYRSRRYDIDIVDRVGGGDAFSAGLIYGLRTYADSKDALEFATAAACLKHSIPGDANRVSVDEVEQLMQASGSRQVNR